MWRIQFGGSPNSQSSICCKRIFKNSSCNYSVASESGNKRCLWLIRWKSAKKAERKLGNWKEKESTFNHSTLHKTRTACCSVHYNNRITVLHDDCSRNLKIFKWEATLVEEFDNFPGKYEKKIRAYKQKHLSKKSPPSFSRVSAVLVV